MISIEEEKFSVIYEMDGYTPQDFIDSLALDKNRKKVFQAGEGAGASGSFFFFSDDNRFIIKTLRGHEKKVLLDLLDDYINHIQCTSNKSLLTRIYGVFTIKTNFFAPMDVIIMQNTIQMNNPQNSKVTFDLKGSTVSRYTKTKERSFIHQKRVLKDLNLLEMNKALNNQLIRIPNKIQEELLAMLDKDS